MAYNTWAEDITTSVVQVQNKTVTGEFALDFQTGDHANIKLADFYGYLPVPLTLGPGSVCRRAPIPTEP